MRFIDQAAKLTLCDRERLLRIDFIHYREFSRRKTRQGEAAASGAQRQALAFARERDARLLGQRAKNIQ